MRGDCQALGKMSCGGQGTISVTKDIKNEDFFDATIQH
jgi:hypothetical protein